MKYRYGKPMPDRLHTLEEPGRPLAFDADRGLVGDLAQRCNLKSLAADLRGKGQEEMAEALRGFGQALMEATIELADGKYRDRAGEIIERVAAETGISFPHHFQRYVELSIIGCRPLDRWNVARSTTKELVLQVFSCSVLREAKEAGLDPDRVPCPALCLASFQAAARQTGDQVEIDIARLPPQDGVCQFSFVRV